MIRKLHIILCVAIFLIAVPIMLKGQGLNQRIGFFVGAAEVGWNTLENDSGYLMIGGTVPGIPSIGIIQTDFSGNILFQKTILDTNIAYFAGFQGSLIKVSSGGYAMYGGKIVGGTISFSLLYRFNNIGDTLWTKTLGDSTFFQAGSQVKETLDGGFICIGQNTKNSGQNWVVKTDSAGNIEWERWYGSGLERPTAIAVCTDSGYIWTGWTRLGIGGPNKDNIRISKIDKNGNLQWTKIFGQAKDDNAWSINTTQDGGYIFGGSITLNSNSFTHPYAIRLNPQGDTLWTRYYPDFSAIGNSPLNSFKTILELPDGNFIAAGEQWFTDGVIIGRHDGLIIKIKPNGSVLWQKTYRIPWMSGKQTSFEIKDIRPTSDGGFICGGVVYPAFPDTGTQDMWLLKIDSNGCVDTNSCVIVTTIEENTLLTTHHPPLKVYPNPNNGLFTIELTDFKNATAEVYTISGQLVLQKKLQHNVETIDISWQLNGIYFVKVIQNNHVTTQKLIKTQ